MPEYVILVDQNDQPIGTREKLQTHQDGALHRALSIFVFNSNGQMLLQQRAYGKYHSGGLWSNTCCTHPRPDESTLEAAHRRLREEMGFDCELVEIFSFTYHAELDMNLIEHEYDHVFVGLYEHDPHLNADEAEAWKWMDVPALQDDLKERSDVYTPWFKIAFNKITPWLEKPSALANRFDYAA